jgi:hypothetical protein
MTICGNTDDNSGLPHEHHEQMMAYPHDDSHSTPTPSAEQSEGNGHEFSLPPSTYLHKEPLGTPPSMSTAANCDNPSPPSHAESFASRTGTKIPARLFGSQGARLGLDLDLDVPLSLDVSFHGSPSDMSSASTPYSSQNPPSAISCDSSPYPYTPSPPNSAVTNPDSAASLPSHHKYSYTQTLMDTNPDIGAGEFHAPAGVSGVGAIHHSHPDACHPSHQPTHISPSP